MKAKTKLIATLMAMCLVITLGVFGILAVKTLNMSVGGNITFNADGVAFTIGQGKFYRTDKTTEYANITSQTGKMTGFSMNTNTKLADVEDEIESWTGLELALDSQGDAVLKFNIKNDMTDKELYVMFQVTLGTNTNNNMNIVCATSEKLAASANKDIEITFDILDDSINAGLTGFKIDLTIGEKIEVNASTGAVTNQSNTKFTNAKYTLNTTAKIASVTRASDNISGEVVIMDRVYVGTQEYAVTSIGNGAFDGCGLLQSIIIPNTITTIEGGAFYNCWELGNTKLPNSLTTIEMAAFYMCNSMSELEIPTSVTSIGTDAFAFCTNLKSITINSDTPQTLGNNAFSETECPIYVPGASVHLYKTATNWSTYKARIKAIPGTEGDQVAMPKTINMTVTSPGNQYTGYQNIFYKIDNSEWFDNKNWVYVEGLYTETLAATNTIRFVKILGENVNEVPSDVEYININEQSYTSAIIGVGTYLVISLESETDDRYYYLGVGPTDFSSWQLDVSEFADDIINLRVYWDDD